MKYKIYHWDTFDNETFQVGRTKKTIHEAEEYVWRKYGDRLHPSGADRVDIVDEKGNIVRKFSVR